MRTIVAICSDFQSGSSLGLVDPKTLLSREDADGNEYQVAVELNPAQSYLWEIYSEGLEEVLRLAGTDPIHLIVNGDMTQGDRFADELSYSTLPDQVQIASDLICRWKDYVKTIRLTKSTRVHAFKDGAADHAILSQLKLRLPEADVRLVSHGQVVIDGAVIDYAHHGPPGGVRSWLKGNLMRFYVKSLVDTAMKDGRSIPNAVLRAHKHERVEEWVVDWRLDTRIKTVGITTPSFQMMTSHAQKVTNSEPKVTNGMVALELVDGAVKDVHWFSRTRYLLAQEVIE